MFTTYKWFYIEQEIADEKRWSMCSLYQRLSSLKEGTHDEDWDFFDSLADCKAYIDIIHYNDNHI